MEHVKKAPSQYQIKEYLNESEFQEMLSSWLDEKGIIGDIKSQICLRMVDILRNTLIGKTCFREKPSEQTKVLNLMVAEYLLNNNYEYSLSVFSTEALSNSLANSFTEIALVQGVKNVFSHENISYIFDKLGIKNSGVDEEILKIYYQESSFYSLLYCVIYRLAIQSTKKFKYVRDTHHNYLGKQFQFIYIFPVILLICIISCVNLC